MYYSKFKGNSRYFRFVFVVAVNLYFIFSPAQAAIVSEATEACLDCHVSVTPGIVADWRKSRHSSVSMDEAILKPLLERRVDPSGLAADISGVAVGCAECHMISGDTHADSFEHNDFVIHTVVSPPDCGVCHATEVEEYADNIMSQAYVNLVENDLFQTMVRSVNGVQHFVDGALVTDEPDSTTNEAACLACHGTKVTVEGFAERETEMGEMTFPVLSGWPNQGVGRINPDGSAGACTPCHARHQFSIEVARQPYTCAQCHSGPDTPAFKVYKVSKHGNIHASIGDEFDYDAVPWVVGRDFTVPTCATCHISLLVDEDENIIANRTHRMNDRLGDRLFGLPYAHPYPKSPNTSIIRNKAGLPLPTELTGEPVEEFLIDAAEQNVRRERMKNVCRACHATGWVDGHFEMLDKTIETTNAMTLTATQMMMTIWEEGYASGLPQGDNIFDEAIEMKWVEQWLFYANTIRFAAAMAGSDYGVFANGRWQLARNTREIHDWLKMRRLNSKK